MWTLFTSSAFLSSHPKHTWGQTSKLLHELAHIGWTVCNNPAALYRCLCSVLRSCLSLASGNWDGYLPPWEWVFAFLVDILSRPLGVGCCSVSQHAWCNYTKILQSLFVERVRVLAPELKPLERTEQWTKALACWRDCGYVLGGLTGLVNSCQCLESSLNFQDSVLLLRMHPCHVDRLSQKGMTGQIRRGWLLFQGSALAKFSLTKTLSFCDHDLKL